MYFYTSMGCRKLSYYQQGRALGVNPIFFTPAVEKNGAGSKNCLNSSTYGFNGKEKDDEWTGTSGATYDYGFRIYDARIAKFLSVDPLFKEYPWYTPYQFAGNKPIRYIDLDGLEEADPMDKMRIRQNRSSNLGPLSTTARNSGFHAGHDLYATPGTLVKAVNNGEIIAINNDTRQTAHGNSIVIKHSIKKIDGFSEVSTERGVQIVPNYIDYTYYSFYSHLSGVNTSLNVGDKVKAGKVIGTAGTTGNAYDMKGIERHLHFEMGTEIWNGGPEGAFTYLSKDGLIDPNFGYKTVNFENKDPDAYSGTTGILKTIFDEKGNVNKKIWQKYKSKKELGDDEQILPALPDSNLDDKYSKNQY